jgi:hypothetical protein
MRGLRQGVDAITCPLLASLLRHGIKDRDQE